MTSEGVWFGLYSVVFKVLCPSLWLMTTLKRDGRKKEKEKGNLSRPRSYGDLMPTAYIQMTPSLTSPTFVAPRKDKTASVYPWSDNRYLTDVLLGLALDSLTL